MPSLLKGFEYDIFISYRQNDNKPATAGRRDGWVTSFVDALKDELEATLKNPVSIYFDVNPHDGLLESHQVGASLEKKLKCLVFIPIISQTYCDTQSFAWQHEFLPFNKMAAEDEIGMNITLAGGNVASRVLPIKIHGLDSGDQSILENELGGPIRSIDFIYKEAGVNRPLKPSDDRNLNLEKTDYHNQINKVANALKEIGNSLVKNAETKQDSKLTADVKSSSVQDDGKKKKSPVSLKLILGLLFIPIVLALAYYSYIGFYNKATTPADLDKSIAVMPFVNMSSSADNKYFSDGMQEAVLNHLAKIEDLRVLSRSSMEQYREPTISIPEIATEVGVAYILEGSVQRSEERVLITVQLIAANSDEHVWAENYTRELKDVFSLQSEIAQTVAQQLNAIINPAAKKSIEEAPTDNIQAYEYYLRGEEIRNNAKTITGVKQARYLYQQALELEPEFALPYIGLAITYFELNFDLRNHAEVIDSVKMVINKAISLDPQLADAYQARAWVRFWGFENSRELGIEDLKTAIRLKPNNPSAYNMLSSIYLLGKPADYIKSLEYIQKAGELVKGEGLHEIIDQVGYIYTSLGDYEKADYYYEKAAELKPSWQANSARWFLNIVKGDFNKALNYAQKNLDLYPEIDQSLVEVARTYAHMKEFEKAIEYFDLWFDRRNENNRGQHAFNAFNTEYYYVLLQTNRKEEAMNEITSKVDLLEESLRDSLTYVYADAGFRVDLIQLYAMLDNKEKVMEHLTALESYDFPWGSASWLMTTPVTEGFHNDPDFVNIINKAWEKKYEAMDQIQQLEIVNGLKSSITK